VALTKEAPMYVMVLNDGETYTDLKGCKILRIDNQAVKGEDLDFVIEDVYYGVDIDNGEIITEFQEEYHDLPRE
jgi:hypothetical protein